MKLPDFFKMEILNDLKQSMGLPRNAVGNFTGWVSPETLSPEQVRRLTSSDGLEVTLADLKILDDGTICYKDSRVLLYIRDVPMYGGRETEPRFHISNCVKLIQMREEGRFDKRYVISARTDGKFVLNLIRRDYSERKLRSLQVCQLCLDRLNYHGFERAWKRSERLKAVHAFDLEDFFVIYPRSLHNNTPNYHSDDAPVNLYSANFAELSNKIRRAAGWRCEVCSIDLSSVEVRKYLHVHHRNYAKFDNRPENLQALCIDCHAKVAGHQHMKATLTFSSFIAWRGKRSKTSSRGTN